MGRPKTVNIKTFNQYNKLHTIKQKMICGVEMTILYPIKETAQYYRSVEVWAYCASAFKRKKKDFKLEVSIPTITNSKTIKFLDEHCWPDWVGRQNKDSDITETIKMLKNLFPDKESVFFYELSSILSSYNGGTFLSYDRETGLVREPSESTINQRKYYTKKYYHLLDDPECKRMRERWTSEKDEELSKQYLTEYLEYERDFAYQHHNLDSTFIDIGENAVCYPVAFTENTAEWSKEEYGKLAGYAHAGEIYFVVTPDKVYFEITRHF